MSEQTKSTEASTNGASSMLDAAETLITVRDRGNVGNGTQLTDTRCIDRSTNITFESSKVLFGSEEERKNTVITFKLKDYKLVQCRQSRVHAPKNVLPFHVKSYTDFNPSCCKFERKGCLVKSWKLQDPKARSLFCNPKGKTFGEDITMLNVPFRKIKNGIGVADVKLLRCANPKCAKYDEEEKKVDTIFHYCCYVNMLEENHIADIKFDAVKDNYFSAEEKKIMSKMNDDIHAKDIIIPFCGKSCYNAIKKLREKKPTDIESINRKKSAEDKINRNSMLRWDSDSRNGSFTSEEVIVNWLTDDENAEKYFGGTHGKKAKVNGVTKDSYHVELSDLIFETNCTYTFVHYAFNCNLFYN